MFFLRLKLIGREGNEGMSTEKERSDLSGQGKEGVSSTERKGSAINLTEKKSYFN